ncbi:MAG: MFS transporter [Phycisphaerales bacterium]
MGGNTRHSDAAAHSAGRGGEAPAAGRPHATPLRWPLAHSALASLTTGMVQHGLYFLAHEILGFDDAMNLVLALALFIPYVPGALLAGTVARRFGPRRTVIAAMIVMGLSMVALAISPTRLMLFIAAPLYNMLCGLQWPIVESYIAAGRHGKEMRRAIGWFNIVWSVALAPSLWVIGLTLRTGRPTDSFIVVAVAHLLTLAFVAPWPARPIDHDRDEQSRHTGPEYRHLLVSARILLPLSYVLMNAMSPLLPGTWERLGVVVSVGATLSSTWMSARVVAFALMFWRPGWHGRWGTLLGGGLFTIGGFALVLWAPGVAAVVAGLAAYGIGQGMVYYAALYYGMAVGHAEVESGGAHEAVIGVGYSIGPMLALAARAALPVRPDLGVLIGVGVLVAAGSLAAFRPYARARAKRREAG